MDEPGVHVTLILDDEYGRQAFEDAERGPIWMVNSPRNAEATKELWRKYEGHGDYITLFNSSGRPAEDACLHELHMIGLHHPTLSTLKVVGARLTPRIREVLGKGHFDATQNGFIHNRSDEVSKI